MREIVSVQIGQCGNQVGCAFWRKMLTEHASGSSEQASVYFDAEGHARCILVDMEEGVLSQVRRSEISAIFAQNCFMRGTDGSGNNFGEGYHRHGERVEEFMERFGAVLEKCDSPQAIQTF